MCYGNANGRYHDKVMVFTDCPQDWNHLMSWQKTDNGKKRFIGKPSHKIHLKATPNPVVSVWFCVNSVGTWTPAKKKLFKVNLSSILPRNSYSDCNENKHWPTFFTDIQIVFSSSVDNINVKSPSFLLHSSKHPKQQKWGIRTFKQISFSKEENVFLSQQIK